ASGTDELYRRENLVCFRHGLPRLSAVAGSKYRTVHHSDIAHRPAVLVVDQIDSEQVYFGDRRPRDPMCCLNGWIASTRHEDDRAYQKRARKDEGSFAH